MPIRFHCPQPLAEGCRISLPEAAAHHAERVLRLREGDLVSVFDGAGREHEGRISFAGREVTVMLGPQVTAERESPLQVTLVQALAVADKMDWIVQKAVEAGVAALQPIAAERSVLRLEGERAAKRVAHWQQVAIAAAEQCGRVVVSPVAPIESLPRWLSRRSAGPCWVLHTGDAERLSQQPRPTGPVALLVGPEGGWSEPELATLRAAGATMLSLGARVLRTETAGLAAMAAMNALWGDY